MATNRREHPPNPEIARRIKSALQWHEMSQADLKRVLGYASSSISQILSGATRPSDQTVKRIADALGEDFDFLMAYKDEGSTGYGAEYGALMGKIPKDLLTLLLEMTQEELTEQAGKIALEQARKRRKSKRVAEKPK